LYNQAINYLEIQRIAMFKIAFIALLSYPLLAGFFPKTIHTSVTNVEGETITLKHALPKNGMSAAVVHTYTNDLTAITSYLAQTSKKAKAVLIDSDIAHHDKLPTIQTKVSKGDKVIGGYLYNNVLLLAPDAATYTKTINSYSKKWIHPDLYALFLSNEGESVPTKENLFTFAKKYQVGLVYMIQKDKAILLDPLSGKVISEKSMKHLPSKGQYPFYMHFEKLDSGWFGSDDEGNYYDTVGAF